MANIDTVGLPNEEVLELVLLALDETQKHCRERLLSASTVAKLVNETLRNPQCCGGRVRSGAVPISYVKAWSHDTTTFVDYYPNENDLDGKYVIRRRPCSCNYGDGGIYRINLLKSKEVPEKVEKRELTALYNEWIDKEAAQRAPQLKCRTPYQIEGINLLDKISEHVAVITLADESMILCLSTINLSELYRSKHGNESFHIYQRERGEFVIRKCTKASSSYTVASIIYKIRAIPYDTNYDYITNSLICNAL